VLLLFDSRRASRTICAIASAAAACGGLQKKAWLVTPAMSFFRSVLLLAAALPVLAADPVPTLQLHKWSGDINVPDPVACTVDPQGRVYVTQTTRRKVGDLDIREHTKWIPNDVAMEDIEQKKAFYHDVLAPGKMLRPEGSLKDHNGDGSIDWKDLTVHSERIYRLEDTDGDGTADKKTVFAEGFNTEVTGIAAGILWHDGWIYATIAPDLWRLRDTNDDGVADEREVLVHGFGHHIAYAGHDMHGLTVGPDGRIYWSIGDKGVSVAVEGGARVAKPHEGCVLRCEPDGSNFEIFAHGLRNVQEIAFDQHGNLFGVDNDADKSGEKERFVHITEQSDSGWRCGYQYMKGFCPWMDEGLWQPRFKGQPDYITPPLASSHDGPAGFAFNPGTALSKAWRGFFFGNQFPSGKTNAFRVSPSGASFTVVQDELVSSGVMGIGMSWGPDGRLYMADWGGDYALNEIGAVWTIDDPAGVESEERKITEQRLRDGFSDRDAVQPLALLGDADQRVRLGAQFEAVNRGDFSGLLDLARNAQQPQLARIHAIWGLGQGMRARAFTLSEEQADALLADKDVEIRAQVCKIVGDAEAHRALSGKIVPLLLDASLRVRFHAALALGKLKAPEATDALLELARANDDKDAYLRHAVITALAGCGDAKTLHNAATSGFASVRRTVALTWRRLRNREIVVLLHDRDDTIASEAARAVHDDESIPDALPELASLLDHKRAWPDAVARRSLNANFRLGGKAEAGRVAQYALRAEAPVKLREEALTLLKLWSTPPPLDRVDGRARQHEARPAEIVAEVARPRIDSLMALKEPSLKSLAVQVMAAYKLPVAASAAASVVMESRASTEVRVEALKLLADQHASSDELKKSLEDLAAGKSTPDTLRVVALQIMAVATPGAMVPHAVRLLSSGTTLEKQKSCAALAAAKNGAADEVLLKEMDQLIAGKCPATRQLDLLEAVKARSAEVPALAQKVTAFETPRAALMGTPGAFAECLEGGDSAAGKEIVNEHLAANCVACHRFDSKDGSNVGPPLSAIGAQKDRAYLLEALVAPMATITPGYGMVAVTLKDGRSVSGALVSSDDTGMTLRLADGTPFKVPAGQIESKTVPISVMPPMSALLTKRELRDVVAYLAGLKGGTKSSKATSPPSKTTTSPKSKLKSKSSKSKRR
jgi:quinoprotein glucose dehydrogenase